MTATIRAGVVQLNAGTDYQANMAKAQALVMEGIQKGAKFVVLPEVFSYRGPKEGVLSHAESIPGPTTKVFQKIAKDYNVAILLGSVIENVLGNDRVANTSVLIDEDGAIQTVYRKMHLFDVQVERHTIRESDTFLPGSSPSIGKVGDYKVGLSICYDLRFPELYRYYAARGVTILCVPSSFTKPTGAAHWEVLVRARAVENLCFVLAPNQHGLANGGVPTYGNSLIVNPWGQILAKGSADGEEVLVADLDGFSQRDLRAQFPVLDHTVTMP
ncbi:carbon-nitrogen hydrolase family protein [bacterium]|nr:carbon-nitrogen hydrolase family protein [bacterium]